MASESKTKAKNKAKNSNKTKIFLANPKKPKCPSLDEEDLNQLEQLLIDDINKSQQNPRLFATSVHVCLGLESSLRAIKNGTAGCILLSTSIKPRYLVGLIARNAYVKDETVPTFAQLQLENITERIFGIKTLALVLPKQTDKLGTKLGKWIEKHRLPKKLKVIEDSVKIKMTRKRKRRSSNIIMEQSHEPPHPEKQRTALEREIEIKSSWSSSSYISFSEKSTPMDIDGKKSAQDEGKLLNALDSMAKKVKRKIVEPVADAPSVMRKKLVQVNADADIDEDDDEDDDFLSSYAPLTVHKICSNPDRKPRKKRKKNVNKSKK